MIQINLLNSLKKVILIQLTKLGSIIVKEVKLDKKTEKSCKYSIFLLTNN